MENLPPARMLIYLSGEGEIRSLFSYSCIHIRSVNCDIKTTYSVSHHAQSREDEQHKTYPKNLWPLPPPAHSLKLTHTGILFPSAINLWNNLPAPLYK